MGELTPMGIALVIQIVIAASVIGGQIMIVRILKERTDALFGALDDHNKSIKDHEARILSQERICEERHRMSSHA